MHQTNGRGYTGNYYKGELVGIFRLISRFPLLQLRPHMETLTIEANRSVKPVLVGKSIPAHMSARYIHDISPNNNIALVRRGPFRYCQAQRETHALQSFLAFLRSVCHSPLPFLLSDTTEGFAYI